MNKPTWIADGEKYASVCLEVKLDKNFSPTQFGSNCWALTDISFQIPMHWKEWLGSIRTKELEACNLFLLSKFTSSSVGILDGENQLLQRRVNNFYVGLLLSSSFSPSHEPVLITGSCQDGEIGIQQQQDLDSSIPSLACPYPAIELHHVRQAAQMGTNFESLSALPISGGCWRLFSALHIYTKARAISDILDRIHQYCRCIEGFILPEPGRTKQQFKSRTEIFIGPSHHDLMGEIYDVRSAVEHMHENHYLEKFDRLTRLDLLKKEAIVEFIARAIISRTASNKALWQYFANTESLKKFWDLSPAERQKIWGESFDPLNAISKFNPEFISDQELGATL